MVSRFVLLSTVLFLISGCASTQLNHNTMDLASTTDDLLQRQVLHNLERFIDSDAAIPAQIVITSGAASTTNSLTPSISAPFANGVNGTQVTRPAITGSLSASDTWSQNWGFAPINDVYQMRRLSALYRYAVDGDAAAFVQNYPPLFKSINITRSDCLRDAQGRVLITIKKTSASGNQRDVTLCATATGQSGANGLSVGATTLSDVELVPDEHYLKGPACAVCMRRHLSKTRLVPNERLQPGWLRWRNLPGAGSRPERLPLPGDQPLGTFGHHELFAAQGQGSKFAEFTLFILAASTQTDATSASNSTSSTGGGKGNKPGTQTLITPQGEVIPVVPSN
jgi:hypothetical protein